MRFVQRRQAATFQSHVESSIDPVDDPTLSLDRGWGALLQQQLLSIENRQTEVMIKEIMIPSVSGDSSSEKDRGPGKGKSASRSGELSAVARCVESSGPDVRIVVNWHWLR